MNAHQTIEAVQRVPKRAHQNQFRVLLAARRNQPFKQREWNGNERLGDYALTLALRQHNIYYNAKSDENKRTIRNCIRSTPAATLQLLARKDAAQRYR